MMPPPIIGPEPRPWASSEVAASNRVDIANAAATIEFVKLLLLRTASSFWRSFLGRPARRRIHRHLVNHQIHGAINRNVRHTSLLVDPAVAIELVLLIHQEVAELATLVSFEHGSAVLLESFIHVSLRDHARLHV